MPESRSQHEQLLMTFNLRYDNPSDGPNDWQHRKKDVAIYLVGQHPDFLGCQEALYDQVQYLNSVLSPVGYKWFGVGRDDGKIDGEFNPIFYDAEKYKLLNEGVFWLSLTPNDSGTKYPGAGCNRICQYGQFKETASGKQFWHFNTHLDSSSAEARNYGAELILKKIKELVIDSSEPYFLTGDFNSKKTDLAYQLVEHSQFTDSENVAKTVYPGCSFVGFDNSACELIDFIFIYNISSVIEYCVDKTTRPDGRNLSDHRPVWVIIKIFPS